MNNTHSFNCPPPSRLCVGKGSGQKHSSEEGNITKLFVFQSIIISHFCVLCYLCYCHLTVKFFFSPLFVCVQAKNRAIHYLYYIDRYNNHTSKWSVCLPFLFLFLWFSPTCSCKVKPTADPRCFHPHFDFTSPNYTLMFWHHAYLLKTSTIQKHNTVDANVLFFPSLNPFSCSRPEVQCLFTVCSDGWARRREFPTVSNETFHMKKKKKMNGTLLPEPMVPEIGCPSSQLYFFHPFGFPLPHLLLLIHLSFASISFLIFLFLSWIPSTPPLLHRLLRSHAPTHASDIIKKMDWFKDGGKRKGGGVKMLLSYFLIVKLHLAAAAAAAGE